MNKEKLSEALSYLDDDIIEETEKLRNRPVKSHNSRLIEFTRKPWFKTALAAAAVIVILIGGTAVARNMRLATKSAPKENMLYTNELSMQEVGDGENYREAESDGISTDMAVKPTATSFPEKSLMNESKVASTNSAENTQDDLIYDLYYISTFCAVTCNAGKVSGSYGFDLSENADYYVETGEEWTLEVFKGEEWTLVEPKETPIWIEPVYSIGQYPGTNHFERKFNLDAYGELKEGKYRIAKNIYVLKTINGAENVYNDVIYFDFDIKF